MAVLVNDFGSINIDADLIVGVDSDGDVINLANGCVCCNVRDDLVAAVTGVMARPEQPEYILLEASGVAEPSGIALTFMDEGLRDRIRLDGILCVVDAEQIFAAPEMMELKLRQVAFADLLILNKVDLVTREEIERIKAWLDDRFHRYRLVEAANGNVPLEVLLSVGRFGPLQPNGGMGIKDQTEGLGCDTPGCGDSMHGHRHDHAQIFTTWSYESEEPLRMEALREAVRNLPTGLYRCKGVVLTAEEPARRVILHTVGKRVDITVGDHWNGRRPQTRIVAIATRDGVDDGSLREVFDTCRSETPHQAKQNTPGFEHLFGQQAERGRLPL